MRSVLRVAISSVIIAIIFFFLLKHLITNWNQIPFGRLRIDYGLLILSLTPLFVNFAIYSLSWKYIVEIINGRLPFGLAFWILSSSQLAKYVPGGIWYTLGRAYMAKTEGYGEGMVAVSVIMESIVLLVVGVVLVLASMMLGGAVESIRFAFFLPFAMIVPFLYTPFLRATVNLGLKVFRKKPISFEFGMVNTLIYSLFFILLWLAQALGFCLFVNAIQPTTMTNCLRLLTIYILSWIVGYIAPFAPGGLGVREGIMTFGLSTLMPSGLAVAVSLLARIWITVFELVVLGAGLLIRPKQPL